MNCNKLVYKGRKGLGRHCNLKLHLVWQALSHRMFIFDSYFLYWSKLLFFLLLWWCGTVMPGYSWGLGGGSHGRLEPTGHTALPDAPLSQEHDTSLMMGVILLRKLVSSNSHHIGRKTALSVQMHMITCFQRAGSPQHPAEVAPQLFVSRDPRASKMQTHPEWLLPKIHQLQSTPFKIALSQATNDMAFRRVGRMPSFKDLLP